MDQPAPDDRPDAWTAIKRGLRLRCPKCGEGPILAGYLKPAESCASCGEDFTNLRADDGPAWATIILVGHLVSPSFLLFATPDETLRLIGFIIIVSIMLGLTFFFLPRMKGLFMALIWRNSAGAAAINATAPE